MTTTILTDIYNRLSESFGHSNEINRRLTPQEHDLLAEGYLLLCETVGIVRSRFRQDDFGDLTPFQIRIAKTLSASPALHDRQKFTILTLAASAFPDDPDIPELHELRLVLPRFAHTNTDYLFRDVPDAYDRVGQPKPKRKLKDRDRGFSSSNTAMTDALNGLLKPSTHHQHKDFSK